MGGEPYFNIVDYEENFDTALEKLRKEVFKSGDFYGVEYAPKSIEEALEMVAENGTRSILDISRISKEPDYCCAAPLKNDELLKYYNTEKPSLELILELNKKNEFWDDIERGMARIVICYENEIPMKLFFAGYSFD